MADTEAVAFVVTAPVAYQKRIATVDAYAVLGLGVVLALVIGRNVVDV